MSRLGLASLTPLTVWSIGTAALFLGYVAAGVTIPAVFTQIGSTAWAVLVVLWVSEGVRKTRGTTPCYEFSFFVALFFPLSVVWYCLRSRRGRGLLTLLLLLFLGLFPIIIASVTWVILYGEDPAVTFE